ncbi:MAG: hypothetical protein A2506_12555 [Elusimicrobia bacterium RIFOXYD12_FULL_66_9]|nr:MAG: hypothetical protein A2506_12555 [Elusimicrobia bacterium RIFOXYD12_FULL_66_9]
MIVLEGAQFASSGFEEIRFGMDGRDRCFDNIFVERLWRSVKYEKVYLHDYGTVADANRGLGNYFPFYNGERLSSFRTSTATNDTSRN